MNSISKNISFNESNLSNIQEEDPVNIIDPEARPSGVSESVSIDGSSTEDHELISITGIQKGNASERAVKFQIDQSVSEEKDKEHHNDNEEKVEIDEKKELPETKHEVTSDKNEKKSQLCFLKNWIRKKYEMQKK